MSDQFIAPNWHVTLNHYPLALLTVGLIIEVFSFAGRRSSVRLAGRYMILLGALAMLPAAASGLYAFRDVLTPGPIVSTQTWHEVVAASHWTEDQWRLMERHIWLAGAATVLFALGAVAWLVSATVWRERLSVPALAVFLVAFVLVVIGAWHGGESVYRHGIAVPAHEQPPAGETGHQIAALQGQPHARQHFPASQVEYYIPPLQLHLVLAGFTMAAALAAFGMSLRRRVITQPVPARPEHTTARVDPGPHTSPPPDVRLDPVRHGVPGPPPGTVVVAAPVVQPVFPARFWLLAAFLAILTALAGLWFTNDWRLRALIEPIENPFARQEMQRLFGHVLFGTTIILLTLILAGVTRFARGQRVITVIIGLLLVVAVIGQVWLGILMLFDSATGSVTGFSPP